ncbi:MAG: hypothetical protein AAGI37_14770 [Planctomycetota bacterium]
MKTGRSKPIPLPSALLALSVAVCLGAAGTVEASALRTASSTKSEQRETLEHLLEAIQQAAKKLTDRLDSQVAALPGQTLAPSEIAADQTFITTGNDHPAGPLLREALLNLPPPAC